MNKKTMVLSWLTVAMLSLTACSSDGTSSDQNTDQAATPSAELVTLKIGASPTPHGEILRFINDNMAAQVGLVLDVVEFNDYILPNKALDDGSLDGNYFQHLPYLEAQIEEFGYDFYAFPGVHIEPLGIYSAKHQDLNTLPQGATIGVSNDPANQARGLRLLETAGFISLRETGAQLPTIDSVANNPFEVKLTQLEAQLLPSSMPDFDYVVINGNYAIDAGLQPSVDALQLEDPVNNPYSNMLVVRTSDKDRAELVTLDMLLHSDQVREFIEETWTDGAVIPAF
ncbi:MAG: MetQ/NlpA family ABC transporter substrate-binding protein [Micrococcales bacterium]|nr:MetQ/NlpA family ABC transporter substrate-binding protein [Micrococcales bacterium]